MLATRDLNLHVEVFDMMKPGISENEGINALRQASKDRLLIDGYNLMLIAAQYNPDLIYYPGNFRISSIVGCIILFNKCDRDSF